MVEVETYRHKMFKGILQELVVRNKAIFMKAIIAYANSVPEPTRDDTYLTNIHVLMDIRDEFMKHVNIPGRMKLIDALFKIAISEYAHDTVYQFFIDWLINALRKVTWTMPNRWESTYWNTYVPKGKGGSHGNAT